MIVIRSTDDKHLARAKQWHTSYRIDSMINALSAAVKESELAVRNLHTDHLRRRHEGEAAIAQLHDDLLREDERKMAAYAAFEQAKATGLRFSVQPRECTTAARRHASMPATNERAWYISGQFRAAITVTDDGVEATIYRRDDLAGAQAPVSRLMRESGLQQFCVDADGALSLRKAGHDAQSFYTHTSAQIGPFYSIVCAQCEVRIHNPSTDKLVVIDLAKLDRKLTLPVASHNCETFPVPIAGRLYLDLGTVVVSIAADQFY